MKSLDPILHLDMLPPSFLERRQNEASGQYTTGWCSILTLGPCCSFARHVVGKMEIYSVFAHHYAQPR